MKKDLRGSRLRCLILTSLSGKRVADVLTDMVTPFARVGLEDHWMPGGFLRPDEAKLGEISGFLSPQERENVTAWWLQVRRNANTPNWDIVSTCAIENRRGLVLVEAKAYDMELRPEGKVKTEETNENNHEHIALAIRQANDGLNDILGGWSLSRDSCYQLANRFAWAWKLADMGTPVVLVYLGFLNATEMEDRGHNFLNHQEWYNCIMSHTGGVVPHEAWERILRIRGTPLVPLVRSADFSVTTGRSRHL